MINGEILTQKIKWLQQEIRELKTAHIKTASTISTIEKTTSVDFTITSPEETTMISTKRAIVTLTSTDGSNMISACYLDGMTYAGLNNRYVFVKRISSGDGVEKFDVLVLSVNYNDYQIISQGGSVNVSYNLKLTASSDFTVSIEYRNILGGSS